MRCQTLEQLLFSNDSIITSLCSELLRLCIHFDTDSFSCKSGAFVSRCACCLFCSCASLMPCRRPRTANHWCLGPFNMHMAKACHRLCSVNAMASKRQTIWQTLQLLIILWKL